MIKGLITTQWIYSVFIIIVSTLPAAALSVLYKSNAMKFATAERPHPEEYKKLAESPAMNYKVNVIKKEQPVNASDLKLWNRNLDKFIEMLSILKGSSPWNYPDERRSSNLSSFPYSKQNIYPFSFKSQRSFRKLEPLISKENGNHILHIQRTPAAFSNNRLKHQNGREKHEQIFSKKSNHKARNSDEDNSFQNRDRILRSEGVDNKRKKDVDDLMEDKSLPVVATAMLKSGFAPADVANILITQKSTEVHEIEPDSITVEQDKKISSPLIEERINRDKSDNKTSRGANSDNKPISKRDESLTAFLENVKAGFQIRKRSKSRAINFRNNYIRSDNQISEIKSGVKSSNFPILFRKRKDDPEEDQLLAKLIQSAGEDLPPRETEHNENDSPRDIKKHLTALKILEDIHENHNKQKKEQESKENEENPSREDNTSKSDEVKEAKRVDERNKDENSSKDNFKERIETVHEKTEKKEEDSRKNDEVKEHFDKVQEEKITIKDSSKSEESKEATEKVYKEKESKQEETPGKNADVSSHISRFHEEKVSSETEPGKNDFKEKIEKTEEEKVTKVGDSPSKVTVIKQIVESFKEESNNDDKSEVEDDDDLDKTEVYPGIPCEYYVKDSETCWYNRQIGTTLTFLLESTRNSGNNITVHWKKVFFVYNDVNRVQMDIVTENSPWNMVVGSAGRELRISPLAESDMEPNYFQARIFTPRKDRGKKLKRLLKEIFFRIFIIPVDMGLVYKGEEISISIDNHILLPASSLTFQWEMERADIFGEKDSLPSNVKISPSGRVIEIKELKKGPISTLACLIYSKSNVFVAKRRFHIMAPKEFARRKRSSKKKKTATTTESTEDDDEEDDDEDEDSDTEEPNYANEVDDTTTESHSRHHSVDRPNTEFLEKSVHMGEDLPSGNLLQNVNAASNLDHVINPNQPDTVDETAIETILSADDQESQFVSLCDNDFDCNYNARCIFLTKEEPSFCQCLQGYHGNGIFCCESV